MILTLTKNAIDAFSPVNKPRRPIENEERVLYKTEEVAAIILTPVINLSAGQAIGRAIFENLITSHGKPWFGFDVPDLSASAILLRCWLRTKSSFTT